MVFKIKIKSLVLSALMVVGAAQIAQAGEKNGFFLGLGYQQGKGGGGEYRKALSSGFPLYGLSAQVGGVGFANKWFGGQVYAFFDWDNSALFDDWRIWEKFGKKPTGGKWDVYAYGGAADMIVNIIPADSFAIGLVGGIQLAGNTWSYNNFSHSGFQFLFNAGGRIRFKEHVAVQAGIKFPMIPQRLTPEIKSIRRYVWYVNLNYIF
ncbi:outer membrane beta-barrel protein [Helicobacter bizzozeronii]|uniref:Outer membrane protein 17 n=3 Tax=Helicobacter bizzozeronii TaxID=56877 RepID=F8KUE0_HELBC|nr:outer membrane beta-barrel protein [Helicobacter bizzozeronii]CCB80499.1 outer membrane protein 17 [Helicobacter bizzozeronii CIII-1]SFZ72004.1 OMP468 [Helicobacter bizzozeronii]